MKASKITTNAPFSFEAGGILPNIDILYHSSDRPYRKGDRVVWICHALTGNSDPEEWWPQMVGEGKLIDPAKDFVVCVNMLCSPYGSSSPASINPATGKPFMLDFPRTTVRDMVAANILIRKHLGIDKINILLGPSIGGFQAYEWVISEPEVIEKVAFIATTPRVCPYLTAFCESQRMAILADSEFLEAKSLDAAKKGLACARSIALISYRTLKGYNATQFEKEDDTLFADRAASYQRYQGKKLVDRFDAYCYYYLSHAVDSQNVGRGRGGVSNALQSIKAQSLVVGIDSDQIFPAEECKKHAQMIPGAIYKELKSDFGHDGFLIESDPLREILSTLF